MLANQSYEFLGLRGGGGSVGGLEGGRDRYVKREGRRKGRRGVGNALLGRVRGWKG